MPLRQSRRPLALFALAIALLAALPCAAFAGEASCCGAQAHCTDAGESPCAQLAATPCCGAAQSPLAASAAPSVPIAPVCAFAAAAFDGGYAHCAPMASPRGPVPGALADHATIRDVRLRL